MYVTSLLTETEDKTEVNAKDRAGREISGEVKKEDKAFPLLSRGCPGLDKGAIKVGRVVGGGVRQLHSKAWKK